MFTLCGAELPSVMRNRNKSMDCCFCFPYPFLPLPMLKLDLVIGITDETVMLFKFRNEINNINAMISLASNCQKNSEYYIKGAVFLKEELFLSHNYILVECEDKVSSTYKPIIRINLYLKDVDFSRKELLKP